MKQITVNARVAYADNNLLYLEIEHGGQKTLMSVFDEMLLAQIASLILDQEISDMPPLGLQKQFTITYHEEQQTDPETGKHYTVNVVDEVQAAPRKKDKAATDLQAMGNWATWSAIEAITWINANVTDLASAKQVLKRLAELVIYLRDIVIS